MPSGKIVLKHSSPELLLPRPSDILLHDNPLVSAVNNIGLPWRPEVETNMSTVDSISIG